MEACDIPFSLSSCVRPHIWRLPALPAPEFEEAAGEGSVRLHANESPYNAPLNRYASALYPQFVAAFSAYKGIAPQQLFLGNGRGELIDMVFRLFCCPEVDNVVSIEPTEESYAHYAAINAIAYRSVPLSATCDLEVENILAATDEQTKVIFLCSPNNPTGKGFAVSAIARLVQEFRGMVVLDEAYVDFSAERSWADYGLDKFPNLIVLQSFSAAFSSAGLRLAMVLATAPTIALFQRLRHPAAISQAVLRTALELLHKRFDIDDWRRRILREREHVMAHCQELPYCEKVFPTAANFFLMQVKDAKALHAYLAKKGIAVHLPNQPSLSAHHLRITIGSRQENTLLLSALRQYKEEGEAAVSMFQK